MYCKHCGKEIEDGSKFCNHCGKVQNTMEDSIQQIVPHGKDDVADNEEQMTDNLLHKLGIVCALVIMGVILIGILEAIQRLSLDFMGNNTLFWCAIDLVIGIAAYYVVRYLLRKKKAIRIKEHYEAVSFTLVIVVIIAISIIGRLVSNKNVDAVQPSTEETTISANEELKSMIKQTQTKLPIAIDEYLSWTNVRVSKDGVLCDYLIDDANFDLYEIDLDEYKEEITENLTSVTDKRFIELCVLTDKSIHYNLVSQWDNTKSVRITFGVYELADMAGINPKEPYGKESSENHYQRRLNEIKESGGVFDSKLKQTREQINNLPSEKEDY